MYNRNTAGQYLGFSLINAGTGAALTGASVTVKRSIDGAAQANATGTVTELGSGQYSLALSQADTNGSDITFLFTATNAVPVEKTVTTAAPPSFPFSEQWGIAGTYTFEAPFTGWYLCGATGGGGGGGGGVTNTSGGGGGGGGGFGMGWVHLTQGASTTISVGAAGNAGAAGGNGGSGGTSSFGSYISAPGGGGGQSSGTGGTAGAAATTSSDVVNSTAYAGGVGGAGSVAAGTNGGGAGAAPGSRFGTGGAGGASSPTAGGGGAGCNGNGGSTTGSNCSGGFPFSSGTNAGGLNSIMPSAGAIAPGVASSTNAISGVGYPLPWGLMPIGSADNFFGAVAGNFKGGIFGGGGGGGSSTQGGIFGGGGGVVGNQAGQAGGLCGGGSGGGSSNAAQAAGGKGGAGYVFVMCVQSPS